MTYSVSVQRVAPRPIAAVRVRMPIAEVPARFAAILGEVYAARAGGALTLDGQNIFVYRDVRDGLATIEFGVGTVSSFEPIGRVVPSHLPAGEAATTTHWGDYGGLGQAHEAVVSWCKTHARSLTGTRWEVYGHWSDDPATRRTDVFYLLESR